MLQSAHRGDRNRTLFYSVQHILVKKHQAVHLFLVLFDQTLVFPRIFCNACIVLCFQHQPLPDAHPARELPLCKEIRPNPGKVVNRLRHHHAAATNRMVLKPSLSSRLSAGMLRAQPPEGDHLLALPQKRHPEADRRQNAQARRTL